MGAILARLGAETEMIENFRAMLLELLDKRRGSGGHFAMRLQWDKDFDAAKNFNEREEMV